ncbi:hypothetical protein M408DRAFT_13053 [Serendipita vermifera MAFF 305830]|uniref:Uncharacterized protein n=1 Tax=Serendipita vermifera MAFF 305830 TaxID=933852 RepID=A0A0C2W1F5_SERVB|nr:hypothetical protein M408DRAFT_13053 [Serendipita vermifera MAFF 305830]
MTRREVEGLGRLQSTCARGKGGEDGCKRRMVGAAESPYARYKRCVELLGYHITGPDRDDGTSGGCGNRSALEYERKRVDMEIERRWVRMGSKWFKMVRMVSDAAAAARRRRQGVKRRDVTKNAILNAK